MYSSTMTIDGMNFLGLLVAFIFSFASGAIWFGPKTFYPIWMRARGVSSGVLTTQQNKPILLFGGTLLGIAVQTLTLGIIINTIQKSQGDFSLVDGSLIGAFLGVGIAAFASLSHRLFGGENLKVWIIETANDALNLTVAGALITFFN
jgi:hypothetical protein